MKTYPISLTAKQAASFLRSILSKEEGKDVIEYFIEAVGDYDNSLLNKLFLSTDPNWNPFPTLIVGKQYSIKTSWDNKPKDVIITEVNLFSEKVSYDIIGKSNTNDSASTFLKAIKTAEEWKKDNWYDEEVELEKE